MRNLLIAIIILTALAAAVSADVAADRGFEKVAVPLNIRVEGSLSGDYRYFLVSPMSVDELKLEADKTITISAENKGGAARVTSLWAVPAAAVKGDVTNGGSEASANFKRDLFDGKVEGAIKLLSHEYQRSVRASQKAAIKGQTYTVSMKDGKPTAASDVAEIAADHGDIGSEPAASSPVLAYVVTGTLAAVAVALIGIFIFRRKRPAGGQ